MGREDPQLKLRLTEEMKAEITQAAKVNGRSVNAEIVYRLERTLQWEDDGEREADELIAALEAKLAEAVMVNRYLEDLKIELLARLDRAEDGIPDGTSKPAEEPIFNMVLDANGHPISWPEIAAHIHRTAKAAGLETVSFRAAVFNADAISSADRDYEYARLVRWYKDQTRKNKGMIRGEDIPDVGS